MEAQEQAAPTAVPIIRSEPWRSEQIGELCAALAKCQAEIKNPKKGKTAKVASKKGESSSYSYAYADISGVCETINAIAPKFGLSHSQILRPNAEGRTCILTMIMHESGQWLLSEYKLPPAGDNHEMGGNITYGRRYALAPMFGIAAEEDTDFNGSHRAVEAAENEDKAKEKAESIAAKFRSGRFKKVETLPETAPDAKNEPPLNDPHAQMPPPAHSEDVPPPPPADDTTPAKTALAAKLAASRAKAVGAAKAQIEYEAAERDAITDESPVKVDAKPNYDGFEGVHQRLALHLKKYDDGKSNPIDAFEAYVIHGGFLGPDYKGGLGGLPPDFVEQVLAQWKKVEPKFLNELVPF